MHTLKTPHATVFHHSDFTEIQINLNENAALDIMDIKEIYAAFFRDYLGRRLDDMRPDDLIKLGYHVGENYR